jgi:hypothetical protein
MIKSPYTIKNPLIFYDFMCIIIEIIFDYSPKKVLYSNWYLIFRTTPKFADKNYFQNWSSNKQAVHFQIKHRVWK